MSRQGFNVNFPDSENHKLLAYTIPGGCQVHDRAPENRHKYWAES